MPTQTVEDARRELARWTDDAQSVFARVTRVFDEHEALRVALETARDDGAQLRRALEAARDEGKELRSTLQAFHDDGAQLREKLAALEADNSALQARLATLRAKHVDLARLVVQGLQGVLSQVMPQVPEAGDPGSLAAGAPPAVETPAPDRPAGHVPAPEAEEGPVLGAPPAGVLTAALLDRALDEAVADPALAGGDDAAPFELGDDEPLEAGPAFDPPARATEPHTRILLVDDEPHFTELISEFLGGRGFEVRTAQSGERALEMLHEFGPRIVLLDLMMPGMGGMETLRRIKTTRPETSVILVTAIDDRDTARRALALGASDYVTKPLTLDFLESVLAVHMAGMLPVQLPENRGPAANAGAPSDGTSTSFFARR